MLNGLSYHLQYTFILMGKALILSGILNLITGVVALVSFIKIIIKKENIES